MEKAQIIDLLTEMGLSIEAAFVPMSKSRNANGKYPTLNYTIDVTRNGRLVFTTDYSMGCAHIPGYRHGNNTVPFHNQVRSICELGWLYDWRNERPITGKRILPEMVDVLYCLVSGADVINYSGFEDWAACMGYDADSRSAEKIYNECLRQALKLMAAVGKDGLAKLQDAYQDY